MLLRSSPGAWAAHALRITSFRPLPCPGERNNDDFLLHYGFVPTMNPHDDVVLFEDVAEALRWCAQEFQSPHGTLEEVGWLNIGNL